jgi:leader peptidase (prepilin peptidase)/N-methyltransferase
VRALFAALCALVGVALTPAAVAAIAWAPADDPAERRPWGAAMRAAVPPRGRTWWVAAALAAGLGAAGWAWDGRLEVVPLLLLAAGLVVVAFVDLDTLRIPDRLNVRLTAAVVAATVVVSLVRGEPGWLTAALLGGLGYAAFLGVFHLVYPAGMGFGDVKLAFVLGWATAWVDLRLTMYAALGAALLGSVIGVAVAVARRDRRAAFPYGPSLCLATWLVLVAWQPLTTGRFTAP